MAYHEKFRPKNLHLIVRKLNYDFKKALEHNLYLYNNDPIVSHFFNALQAIFPEGERFFIKAAIDGAARLSRKNILPSSLKTDMIKFIHQEAFHSQQHKKWTDALINRGYQGLAIYDNNLKRIINLLHKYIPVKQRLAITAAAEHYTASLAYIFTHIKPEILARADYPFQGILLYHAMEEVEHKSVCFDLYQCLSGSYLGRIFGLLFVTFDLILNVYIRYRYLLNKDGIWDRDHRRNLRIFLFGKEGLISGLIFRIKAFLRYSFHPWQTDERKVINEKFKEYQVDMDIEPFILG